LYTGNGTSSGRSISNAVNGTSFQPDLVWNKSRSAGAASGSNMLYDSVRGVGKRLISNATNAEDSNGIYGYLSSFDSGGYSSSAGSTNNENLNENGTTYVAWQWKANGAAVTNTAGSITSQVSANTAAGFSVVTYTGTGANATVGHGLGVAPKWIIVRNRNGGDWKTYTETTGNTTQGFLNDILPFQGSSPTLWNSTSPTSTVFSIGTNAGVNQSSAPIVAYCWAAVPGYSAFGSYTGNGSTDGVFVYTGFRPRFLLTKRTDSNGAWILLDSARSPSNVAQNILQPQDSGPDSGSTYNVVDFLSNGFKFRIAGDPNTSGAPNIYMAFAECPLKYSNAR